VGLIVASDERAGMVGSEHPEALCEHDPELVDGLCYLTSLSEPAGQTVASDERAGMVGSKHPKALREHDPELPDGVFDTARVGAHE